MFLANVAVCALFATSQLLAAEDASQAAATSAGQPAGSLSAEQVKALIATLGDADFKTRAAAQKELVAAGASVLDALEQATKSGDAEVKQRAEDAIRKINVGVVVTTSKALAKNQLWSYAIDNGAISAPAVAGGKAYVMGQNWKLHAVDVKTGKTVWVTDTAIKGWGQFFAGEKVVAAIQMTRVTAYDAKDGTRLWQKDTKPASAPATVPAIRFAPFDRGVGASASAPAPSSGPVGPAARAGGGLAAPIQAGVPQAWVVGDVVVVYGGADRIKGYRALTGDDAWEMEVTGKPTSCVPVMANGVVYVARDTFVGAIDVAAKKPLWGTKLKGCSLLAMGGKTLYCVVGGKVVAMDATTGVKSWDADLPGAAEGANAVPRAPVMASGGLGARNLVADDFRAYVLLGDVLTTFDAKKGDQATVELELNDPRREGEEGEKDPPGGEDGMRMGSAGKGGMNRLVPTGGMLCAVNEIGLFAFDGKTGQRLWMLPLSVRPQGDPVIADGVLYFSSPQMRGAVPEERALINDVPGLHALKVSKQGMRRRAE